MKFTSLLILLILLCTVAGCSNSPDQPVSSEDTPGAGEPPLVNSYAPQEDDSNLVRAGVYLDSSDILLLESFPVQVNLHLAGSLPTPCHALRVTVQEPDQGNRILVEAYSVVDSEKMCAQVLQAFDVTIPLGSFPSGHYILTINGEESIEFDI